MAAIIQSTLNAGTPIQGASREDLQAGDTVGLYSVDSASTYAWSIAYKPLARSRPYRCRRRETPARSR